ncbi:hypothetical protein QE389_000546 [Brevundimonas sp. SORGH_AS 993]|nr:hypothetical protein [Brevundimonas sp. SORGH_AS_0993]
MPDRIEDSDQGRSGQDRVRQVQRIGIGRAQRFQQPNHIVAEHTEQARRHRRQVVGQIEARSGDQGAKRPKGRQGFHDEPPVLDLCAPRDLRPVGATAPDDVGVQRQDGVAALDRPAFHRFQQTGVGAVPTQLQEGRNRRFQVVDQATDDDLGATGRKTGGKGVEIAFAERGLAHCGGAAGVSPDRPRA